VFAPEWLEARRSGGRGRGHLVGETDPGAGLAERDYLPSLGTAGGSPTRPGGTLDACRIGVANANRRRVGGGCCATAPRPTSAGTEVCVSPERGPAFVDRLLEVI
jgi:hypothetical protein